MRLFNLDLFAHIWNSVVHEMKHLKKGHYDQADIKKFNETRDEVDRFLSVLETQADEGRRRLVVSGQYDAMALLISAIVKTSPLVKKDIRISSYGLESERPSIVFEYIGQR